MAKNDEIRDKLRRIVVRESAHALGKSDGKLSNDRTILKEKYLGYGYPGDDKRKRRRLSTYVDRTVMETVEWAKPGLMRVFSGDEIIRFDPRTQQQEQDAADATTYINQVCFGRNIFQIVHDVLTDGLFQRVGWCIAHAPKVEKQETNQYTGLTEQEALSLLEDPSIDMEKPGAVEVQQYPSADGSMLFDLTIHRTVTVQDVRIDPIPTEQVIISGDAVDVEHARFVAHWEVKTASDLRKEGYSQQQIDELPTDDDDDMPEAQVGQRVNASATVNDGQRTGENREYKIYEAWLDADINGDGIAEKVKVTYCGDADECKIMNFEEWPLYRAPLFAACSVPMPHQVVGMCVADLVDDIQDLRTELTRQLLDNIALGNQSELVVNEGTPGTGRIDYDSLLNRGVGVVHRISGDATITPLAINSNSGEALQGIEMSSQLIERRTGVSSRTQALKADALQNTATGASIMEEAINQRLELVARVYAETFFKPLGRYLLHLIHKYHDKQIQLRIKGKFMAFDPRKWDPDMDISVAVGLGTGDRSKLLASYSRILEIQQAFIQQFGVNSPVRLANVVYTCHKMAEAAGLEAPERFFGTEEDAQKAEQAIMQQASQPQPNAQQQKVQIEQQKAQAKIQLDQQKAQMDAQRKAYETQSKLALEKQRTEGQIALKRQEMAAEAQLDATRLAMGERGPGLTNIRGI